MVCFCKYFAAPVAIFMICFPVFFLLFIICLFFSKVVRPPWGYIKWGLHAYNWRWLCIWINGSIHLQKRVYWFNSNQNVEESKIILLNFNCINYILNNTNSSNHYFFWMSEFSWKRRLKRRCPLIHEFVTHPVVLLFCYITSIQKEIIYVTCDNTLQFKCEVTKMTHRYISLRGF